MQAILGEMDSSVPWPELVTGNRENLLEASGPNGGYYLGLYPDSAVFTSSNFGHTWVPNLSPHEQWNQCVIPHTQTIVLASEAGFSKTSSVVVSTNAGSTWRVTASVAAANTADGLWLAIDAVASDEQCGVVRSERTSIR